jgi:hypothetical protein
MEDAARNPSVIRPGAWLGLSADNYATCPSELFVSDPFVMRLCPFYHDIL